MLAGFRASRRVDSFALKRLHALSSTISRRDPARTIPHSAVALAASFMLLYLIFKNAYLLQQYEFSLRDHVIHVPTRPDFVLSAAFLALVKLPDRAGFFLLLIRWRQHFYADRAAVVRRWQLEVIPDWLVTL